MSQETQKERFKSIMLRLFIPEVSIVIKRPGTRSKKSEARIHKQDSLISRFLFLISCFLLIVPCFLLLNLCTYAQTYNTWLQTNGPYGGFVTDIAVDPTNPNNLFASTAYSGFFRSTNGGTQWLAANQGLPWINIVSLALGVRSSSVVLYAGFGWTYGVYKSTNHGDSWIPANTGLPTDAYLNVVTVEPNSVLNVYAGMRNGVFKTTDGGSSWAPRNSGLTTTDVRCIAITPNNVNVVYVGTTNGGLFKSTNGGSTWAVSNSGISATATVQSLVIDPSNPAILYAGTNNGVYRSTNSGGTWTPVNTGLTTTYVLSLVMTSSTTIYAATSGGGIFKTTNSGSTWTAINSGLTNLYAGVLAVQPGSVSTLYVGMQTGDGVFRTTNSGITWTKLNTGITATLITAVASNISAVYASSSYNGIFRSSDKGTTWVPATSGIPASSSVAMIGIDPSNPNTLYAATIDGVYKTVTGGETWKLSNGTGAAVLTNTNVSTVFVHPINTLTVYAGTSGGGLFRSLDGAATWYAFNNPGLPAGATITAHAVTRANTNLMYVGVSAGGTNSLYRTTNAGASWTLVLGLGSTVFRALAIDPVNTSITYAGTSAGIYKTTNGGNSWSLSNQGLTTVDIQAIAVNPTDPNIVYAGTYGGMFRSTDAGNTWSLFDMGMVNHFVNDVALDAGNPSIVYAGMYGSGVLAIFLAPHIVGNTTADFGTVVVNSSADQTYSITNRGLAPLNVSSTTLTGTHATQFSIISGGGAFTLKENESRNIVLRFKPTSSGTKSAILRFQSDAPAQSPFDVALSGTGASATIAVSTTSVDFGTVALGSFSDQTVRITNTGTAPLIINRQFITAGDSTQFSLARTAATTINPGLTDNIVVRFQPTSSGGKRSGLRIQSNASNEPTKDIVLVGIGAGTATITVSANALDFGTVNIGSSLEGEVIVRNSGTAVLSLSSQTISGTDASQFSITKLAGPDIEPGKTDTIRVLFRPSSVGDKKASLKIVSNATNQSTVLIDLVGIGGGVPLIAVSSEKLDFGAVNIGGLAEQSVTVTNQGATTLNLTGQTIIGTDATQFTITRLSANKLNPGKSDFITIRFSPTTVGVKQAILRVQSDASNKPQQDVSLTGIGGGVAAIDVGADSIDFGGVAVGSSVQKAVTVRNSGAATLVISKQMLTGGDSTQFSISKPGAASLSPGQIDSIVVSFSPTSTGLKTTILRIVSNASNHPTINVALIGTGGGAAWITFSSETVDFGAVSLGSNVQQSLTISNTGSSVLNIASQGITGTDTSSFTITKLSTSTLNPGESDNITIRFQPVTSGTKTAQLRIVSNAANEPTKNIALTGVGGTVATISASAQTIDFGSVSVGSITEQSVTISNSGLATLTLASQHITSGDSSQFTITKLSNATLTPGQSDIITIRFQPTSIGSKMSTLRIVSNANNQPTLDISLTGMASGTPVVMLSTTTLDFGLVNYGSSTELSLAISNSGSADLMISDEIIVGRDSTDFAVVSPGASLLAPGQIDSIRIRFQPSANGNRTAQLLIISNDPNPMRDTVSVTLNGVGQRDLVPPQITHVPVPGPVQIGSTIQVNATATDLLSGVSRFELWYRKGGDAWSNVNRISFISGVAEIPGSFVTNEGIDYRIIAEDNAGNIDTFKIGPAKYISVPVIVPAQAGGGVQTVAGTQASAYRLFSVPLDLQDKLPLSVLAPLGSYNIRLWRFFDYRNNAYQELTEFQNDTTRILPGRAFFLITRNSTLIPNTDGITVGTIDAVLGNTVRVPGWQLQAGWNLVGNPFGFDIQRSSLRLGSGDTLRDAWYFNGSWVRGDTLKRFEGLAIKVTSATTLKLVENAQGGFNQALGGTHTLNRSTSEDEWQIQIIARTDEMMDKENYIGVRYGAQMEKDDFDLFEPPMLPGGVSLYFPHREWRVSDIYTTDIRPVHAEGHTWEFVVKAEAGSNLELTFAGVESVPTPCEQYVIDLDRNSAYNLKQQWKISTDAGSGERRFRVIIGTKDYADERHLNIDLIPKVFYLYQNYPNPFNPVTTLQYQLPVESYVTLRVFNMLGEEVRTLVQALQSEGYYEVRFDAAQLPSGVYIVELRASGNDGKVFRAVRKLVLQK